MTFFIFFARFCVEIVENVRTVNRYRKFTGAQKVSIVCCGGTGFGGILGGMTLKFDKKNKYF